MTAIRVHRFSIGDTDLVERFLALRERIYADDYFFYSDAEWHRELIHYYANRPDYRFTLLLAEAPSGTDVARMVVGRQAGMSWGFFGLFECADDGDVAEVLTRTAREIGRSLGANRLVGPLDFNSLHGWMFQLDAARRERWVGDLYHRAYYPDLLQRAGWAVADEAVSGVLRAATHTRLMERFSVLPERLEKRGFKLVRRFDLPEDELLRLVWQLVARSFTADHHRYVPVEYEFFHRTQQAMLQRLCEPECVMGYLKDGEMVAYGTAFTNMIDDLCNPGGMKSRPRDIQREPQRFSVNATAVAPAFRGGPYVPSLAALAMRHALERYGQPLGWRRTSVDNPGTRTFRDSSEILWRHVTLAVAL